VAWRHLEAERRLIVRRPGRVQARVGATAADRLGVRVAEARF